MCLLGFTCLESRERGHFSYEDLLLVAQVVYNDVAIERGLVKALRQICPKGAKEIPTKTLREYLLKLGEREALLSPFFLVARVIKRPHHNGRSVPSCSARRCDLWELPLLSSRGPGSCRRRCVYRLALVHGSC